MNLQVQGHASPNQSLLLQNVEMLMSAVTWSSPPERGRTVGKPSSSLVTSQAGPTDEARSNSQSQATWMWEEGMEAFTIKMGV